MAAIFEFGEEKERLAMQKCKQHLACGHVFHFGQNAHERLRRVHVGAVEILQWIRPDIGRSDIFESCTSASGSTTGENNTCQSPSPIGSGFASKPLRSSTAKAAPA